MENFLNDVETVFTLRQNEVLSGKLSEQAFSWVVDLIVKNKNVMDFIEAKQREYGQVAWKPISDYYHNKKFNQDTN